MQQLNIIIEAINQRMQILQQIIDNENSTQEETNEARNELRRLNQNFAYLENILLNGVIPPGFDIAHYAL